MVSSEDEQDGGPESPAGKAKVKQEAKYVDFKEFATALMKIEEQNQSDHGDIRKDVGRINEDMKTVRAVCKTKQTEREAAMTERELRARIDNKFQDAEDKQRRDRNEMLNKHTMLKQEMSLSMLDADMLGFLKGMHKEWNKLLHRTDKASERIERLDTKFEDVQKFLRSFKGFGKSDRLSSTAKSPNTKRSTPRHSSRQHD